MKELKLDDVVKYVEKNVGTFHIRRLEKLENIKLSDVLRRKNPYLFKAKNILTAEEMIKKLLGAYLSSQEETIFGEFLEGLAIFVCGKAYNGKKSAAEGIDLEFERDNIWYIVSIKSGPNWGNSSQILKMKDNFRRAKRILRANVSDTNIVAVNGCCYGRCKKVDKGEYLKLCGQRFWEFISGDNELYTKVIEPIGNRAKDRNEEFMDAYSVIINKFSHEFLQDFCDNGRINWEKLVKFNSSICKKKKSK